MVGQTLIWWVAIAGIAVISATFLYVVARSGEVADATEVQRSANLIRRWWFWTLIVLGVVVAWVTLAPFPIPNQTATLKADQVIEAVGHQWYWDLSDTEIKAGSTVEFRVTSNDVNHSFAIYAPDGRIVIQTQAMPGYTNKLIYTFNEPGTYRILCLEYCGVAHHNMESEIEVVAATEGK